MHSLLTSFLLGYHGCEREVGERLLGNEAFQPSENNFDWLGPGVYFWESNPDRALKWAQERSERRWRLEGIRVEPFVVGAVINPGLCLDLISSGGIQVLEDAYVEYQAIRAISAAPLPQNTGGFDLVRRNLDCDIIRLLHDSRQRALEPEIDTVRGVFTEGEPIYPSSGFRRKTHIQICVRNQASIQGVFRVPPDHFTAL